MARIRSIKPEFWTSEQVMECSTNTRLLFIGLWNFADDAGRHPSSAKQIKALVFPADDFSSEDVRRMLDELSAHGLISFYAVEGKEYFQITGWHHQKIDRPQKSKYPGPTDGGSPNGRRTLATDEGGDKGKDRRGVEKKEGRENAPTEMAFIGRVIRLKAEDFARWQKRYHAIIDLPAELTKADDYYFEHPPTDGKWFFPVSRWLERAHRDALKGKSTRYDEAWRGVDCREPSEAEKAQWKAAGLS